jgi:LEA14-like dessication related protein
MKVLIAILCFASLFLVSCKAYKDVQEPEYRDIQHARLVEVGLLQTKASADLIFYNPNNFTVTLSSAHGDIYLENQYIGKFELDDKVSVKKNAEFIIPVTLKLDNISAIKNRDIYQKKEVLLRVDGIARISKTGFAREMPINYERMENTDKLRGFMAQ